MLEIVGFEGHTDDTVEVAYGAAACRDGGNVVNLVLRAAGMGALMAPAQWDAIVAKGMVTLVKPPMKIPDSVLRYAAYVMRLRRGTPVFRIIEPRTKLSGSGTIERHEPQGSEFSYYLFGNFKAVERFNLGAAARLVLEARKADKAVAETMKRAALILDPKSQG
jgi:hypothetical protein